MPNAQFGSRSSDGSHDPVVTSAFTLMLTLAFSVDKFGAPTFVSSEAHNRHRRRRPATKLMSSRFLISALCIGAIVLACGPRTHSEATAPQKTRAATQVAT